MVRSSALRLAAVFVFLAAVTPLSAATYSSTTSGNWSSASTWGGSGVPGAGDTATVNGGNVVTLDTSVTVATLTLAGGQITGTNPLNVTTVFNWNSGTLSGASTMTIASGTVGGGGTLDARALTNNGSLTFSGGNYFYMQNGAQVTNNGTIEFVSDGGGIFQSGTLGAMAITNAGTIKKSGGTSSSTIGMPITGQSGSQVLAQSGTLLIAAVTATGSTFDASSGATMEFNTGDTRSLDATCTVSGAGTMYWAAGTNNVSAVYNVTGVTKNAGNTTIGTSITSTGDVVEVGGTLTLNDSTTLSVGNLSMQGGTLAGTAPITLTGTTQTWTGGTIAGTGLLTIPSGTTVTFNSVVSFDTRSISNAGSMVYSSNNYSYFYNSASLTNSGTVNFQGDGGFYIASGSPSVTNSGTIEKTGGTGQSALQVSLTSQSGSQLSIQSGTILFGNVAATGTTLSVSSGATAELYYTTTASFDATSTISGAGTVLFAAGTNTVNASYNITGATNASGGATTIGTNNVTSVGNMTVTGGTLTVNNSTAPTTGTITAGGGTLTLNYSSTLTIATLLMQGGTLAGTASISLTGSSMTWTGGTVGGTGSLTIPNGTSIAFNGYVYFDTRSITNGGAWTYSSNYYSYFYNSSSLTNNGTVTFQGDGGFYIGSGSPSIINNGTITKSGGTGQGGIQVNLTASAGSQVQIQSGTLLLGNVTSTGAAFSVSSGATMQLNYTTTSSFDAASSISGAGTVLFAAGTNTVSAAYNVTGGTKNSGGTTTIGTNVTSVGDMASSGGALTVNNSSGTPTTGTVTVSGGTLTLNYPTTLTIATLTMQGGTLNGTASISLTGPSMTWTGGTVGGSGSLTIPNGTSIAFNGYVYFDTRSITNGGAWTYSSNYYSYFYNSATLTNNGTITFQGDGGFYIASGSPSVTNNGTITKSAGTGAGAIQVSLTAQSGSQLQVQSGTLLLGNVTATGAAFSVSSGATLETYYTTTSTFDAASSISGAGIVSFNAGTNTINAAYNVTGATKSIGGTTTLNSITSTSDITINGGTLTLNAASAISVPTLTMQGGTINGTAPITLTGSSMTWSGGTIAGGGTLTIPNTTTITVTNSTTYFDGRPVSNAGTINFTGVDALYMLNNAVLTNSGTIDFQGDSAIYLSGVAGTTAINNNGLIKKSAGSTSGTTVNVQLNLNAGSQFQVQASTVYFGNVTATGGTLTVASGAIAYFNYTTTSSFDAASTISGAGTVQWYAGTNTVSGTYNITGATKVASTTTIGTSITATGDITMASGTLTLNSASAISVPTLTMQGGTLSGNAPINITGSAQTWSGGAIAGTGTLSIPNTTTTTVSGSFTLDTRTVANAGTMNITGGNLIYMQNNAVLNNSGIIDVQGDGSLYQLGTIGTTAVTNSGTIKKSGGTGNSTFSVPITLQSGGQLLIQAATAYLGNITSTGGTLNLASGATAYIYYATAATFDSASTISGSGNLINANGTNSVAGTISSPITVTGGTLAINSASTQSVPTLTMQGGTLGGSGTLAVTGAAMTWTGGVLGGTGILSIPAGTTVTISGIPYIDTRTVDNAGSITFTSTNYIYMQNNGVLNNSGTIDFPGDNAIYLSGAAGTTMVNDSGTIKKSAGTSSYFTVPLTLQSGGQFLVQSGTVYFQNITGTGGTLNTSSGATAYLYYTTAATFDASSTISGSGTLNNGAGTNSIAGTISSPLTVSGGTLSINSAATQSIPVLTMTGGTLNGTANIAVTSSAMTWSGGVISGSGTFSIPAATTVTIGGVTYLDARAFTNAGTLTFTSTNYLYMENGATLNNTGTISFPNSNGIYIAAGSPAITNNGLITNGSAAATATVQVPTTNAASGVIEPTSGTIFFYSLTNAGTLDFPIAGATAFGKVGINGAATLGGTLTATTIGGYTPPNGTTFQVMTWSSFSGAFATKNLLYSGGAFTDANSSSALTLTAGNGTCYALPASAISWYRAEGNAVDSVGTNNGTVTNATFGTGYNGQGFVLDGSTAYVSAPDSASLHPASLTAEGWVNFSTLPGTLAVVVSKTYTTGTFDSLAIWYDPAGMLHSEVSDAGGEMLLGSAWSPVVGTWYHVALTFDTSTQVETLYLNGTQVATQTFAGRQIAYDTHPLVIGADINSETYGYYFPGTIDEVTLYNQALSATQIQDIYFAATAGKCYSASTPTITSFSPSSGGAGTSVAITGTNLIGASAVSFNGTPAASFTVNSATQITAVVPAGMTTGPISVTTAGGVATSASSFTFVCTPPPATITAPSAVCGNAANVGASVTTTAGATYNWSITNGAITSGQGTSAITFNPGASGIVTLSVTVTDPTSCSANGNANVTINPAPASAITVPASICASTTGNASVTATAGATYNWTVTNGTLISGAGTNAITFAPAASGNVSIGITVISTNGCSSSSTASVPINAAPSATMTAPASVCASAISNASVPFQSGATYNWTVTNGTIASGTGTNAITFTAGASGNVTISVTVANGGCSATSNTSVPINAAPAPVITGPATTCAGSPVTLDAGAGYTSYLWSTGATTQTVSVSPTATTNYSVTVTNANGCSGTTSYTVNVNPLPPSAITAPASICSTATGNASVAATAGATYNWSILNGTITGGSGTNAITFTPGSPGNVTVAITVTSSAGCSSNSNVSIPINGAPSSAITAPAAVCASTAANASVAAQAGATYNWSITNGTINSGAGTYGISFTAGASGNVTLSVTVSNGGCSTSSSVSIPINAVPAPVITGPSTTCAGSPIILDAGPGFSSYLWSTGAATQSITVSPSVNTTYSVSVSNGSCSATTSHPVTVSPSPSAAVSAPSSVTSSSANNGASVPFTAGATYAWTIGNGTITAGQGTNAISFTAGSSGSVTLGVTATDGSCTATGSATVPIVAASGDLTVSVSASPNSVNANSPVAFTIVVSNSGPATAMNVSVSNTISSPTATFVATSSLISCGSPAGPTVTCATPFLSPGDSATITITWNATTTDPALTMASTVTSSNDTNGANNSATASASVIQPQPEPQPNGNPCANPTATSLISPASGATLSSSTVHFTWSSVSGASGYRLWLAVNGAAFASAGDTANTSMDVNISSGSVEWYVETLFTGCSSVESSHRTFSIPPKQNCGANGAATNLSPSSDTNNPSVTFSWSPVTGATSYEVWLSLNGGTPTLLGTTSATSLTHDVPAGALEWFVRANFDGCPQTESAHVQFSYNLPVQCSDSHPLAVAPLNNSLGLISPINFSWKEATGATSYKVWISVNDGAYSVLGTTADAHLDDATVPDGSINWYIEAISNGCPSTKSTVSHFTVVKAPTGCPALTAPLMIVPASASSGVQYTISWQPVGGATSYDVQSSNNLQFTGATTASTTDTQFDFADTNNTAQPLVKYFRVRALATCQADPGPFSDASAVVILPSTTAGKQLQGSAPADQTQVITYTIPLDASLAGLAFTATPNQPWITVTPASGIVPAGGTSLQVQADTDGLPVGTSLGGVTITTSAAGGSSKAHTSSTPPTTTVTTVSVSLVSPSLPTSKSTPPPDALIIPAVAHANGVNSTFQSDVRVTNTSAQVVKYQVTFTPTGDAGIADGKQTTIDIDPGKTIALDDVLGTWFTSLTNSSIGVLEIRPLTAQSSTTPAASSPLGTAVNALSTFASSRTFNVTANGTYGQYIPAIPFANFIGGSKDPASASILSLQQISQSDAFRTNLGFVEGSGQPASVLVSVFDHTGAKVTDFPLQLAAGQHTQFSLGSQGVQQLSDGRVEVKVLSPTGKVTTYASVLDNQTNDPLLVSPVNLSAAGNTTFVVPGVADLSNGVANWRTDMRIFNPTSQAVDTTLSFYSQNGGNSKTVKMTIAPNEVKDLDGTLASTFGITNDGGAVHIATANPSNLIATARTYNQTTNGTYGQFIPAVTPADAAGAGSRPLQLLQLEESDRYRSNVGIVEVSGKPAKVQISVIPPDGRVTGVAEMDLAPNEFRQLNSMLKSFGLGSAYNQRVTVKVISGEGRITAYASVIDQVTQDPTYIPAQ